MDNKNKQYQKMVGAAFNETSANYDNEDLRFFDNSANHLI
ncbi:MAG: hypothetical protein ACJA02_000911 [Myxococcota bacterium]|jgi:hypothetical protein